MLNSLTPRARKTALTSKKIRPGSSVIAVVLEKLENRQLMSASNVWLANGVLNIQGDTTQSNNLTANLVNSGKSIDASGDHAHAMIIPLSSVNSINIVGGPQADYVFVDTNIKLPVTINGGDGNDQIRGGGGYNSITDGNGNDWISGRGTTNYISVGNGKDTVLGANGNDTLVAGDGNDSLDGANGDDSITAGNGNDTITGDSGNDTLAAGNGVDSINGGLGNDHITVGTGASILIPGSGTNYLVVGSTKTIVVPSSGVNTVVNTSGVATTPAAPSTTIHQTPVWNSYIATGSNAAFHPQAVLQMIVPAAQVGIAIQVRGLNSVLGTGSAIDANYHWNFGDPSGEYNTSNGFNASHIFNNPGTYNVTLTVTNALGFTSTVSAPVTIAADTRRAIYVDSVHGSDNNNGLSPDQAVQTALKASQLEANNTEVFFDRGETFGLTQAFKLNYYDLLVGAYGSGANPVLSYNNPTSGCVIFSTNSSSAIGVTVQDLTLTTLNGSNPSVGNQPMAIMAGGYGTTVQRCQFNVVEYAVNASGSPVGLTVNDNTSPTSNGLQGYFVWDQGTDTVIAGNTVATSVHEHVVRTSSATEMQIMDNNFTNNDGKGCIEIHNGSYAWVDGNTVHNGDIRVGPLGLWNEPVSSATNTSVIQNNQIFNAPITVYPGAHDISIRNNVIHRDSSIMIDVTGQDADGRQSSDIRIINNTGINNGSAGIFVKVENHVNGITLDNNLLDQPDLAVGGYTTAPVYVVESSLSSFTNITGNVWQAPKTSYPFAKGGINFVGTAYLSSGYMTPSQWNALPQVGTDFFSDTAINGSTDAPALNSVAATAAVSVPGELWDLYGNTRIGTKLTAGAVEV